MQTLYGRYIQSGSIEIKGIPDSIRELAHCIASGNIEINLSLLKNPQLAPYDAFISAIHVKSRKGNIIINRTGSVLNIQGSRGKLLLLSDNLKWLANQVHTTGNGDHLHIEYHPEHFYLDSASEPLIVYTEL